MRTTLAVAMVVLAVVLGTPGPGSESNAAPKAAARNARGTAIVVEVSSDRGRAPTTLLGVNHQFYKNGRYLWNPDTDAPRPRVVQGAKDAGIQAMRFPGGTVANLYDWKRAIGPERGCQVVGPQPNGPGFDGRALTNGLAFGPDEFMSFMEQVGAKPNIMVPFVTESPSDAADWVEYMNSPVGANPNGGKDWAEERATNGHPAPYRVGLWEIGNEQYHFNSRYWMSPDKSKALRQYVFGGSRTITGEKLGKECAHPPAGIASDGTELQTFEALYPPVDPQSFRLEIGGQSWEQVSDLAAAQPDAHVFALDAETGRVRFGDGKQGAIPPQGSTLSASYRSVHKGYFAFARQMKEVDPSIKVCSQWSAPAFNRLVRRKYDCLATHALAPFQSQGEAAARWTGPLEGHDWFMLKSDSVPARIRVANHTMPRSTPMILTEFLAMHGDSQAYPAWGAAMSHAVFMSSLWAAWLNMRIAWGNGDDFLSGAGHRSVLGGRQHTFTADAVTRRALSPMFSAGGRVISTRITGNPVRRPPDATGKYNGLTVAATRGDGVINLLVVNRFPRKDITSRIRLGGGHTHGRANVRSVAGPSYSSWNRPDAPPSVVLDTRTKKMGATGFTYEFPAASTTVFRIPWRRG